MLLHISDWMPTLLKMAGYEGDPSEDLQLDGVDQSEALLTGESAREEMVYNLQTRPLSGAYRKGDFKIIFGRVGKSGWYDTDNTALQCSKKTDKKARRKEKKKGGRKGRLTELVEKSSKWDKRAEKRREKEERRMEKNFQKLWKSWLPRPGPDLQEQLRLRMKDCNWADFSGQQGRDIQAQSLYKRDSFRAWKPPFLMP